MRGPFLLLSVVAVVVAGCDSGSDSSSSEPPAPPPPTTATPAPPAPATPGRIFTKRDLGRVALQPADAPRGLHYSKAESGPKSLPEVGIYTDSQTRQLRRLGYRAVYDATFDSPRSEVRLASRLWLFAGVRGAQQWLNTTEATSAGLLQPFQAPQLADGSWAAGGTLNGSDLITHAFRVGNVVVVQTLSASGARLDASLALSVARKAAARAKRTT